MDNERKSIPGKVTANKRLNAGHYLITLVLSEDIPKPLPGQFIMLHMDGKDGAFLGRPFSLYHYGSSGEETTIQVLYRVVGNGTRLMSELRRGDVVRILGPHGRAFEIFPDVKHIFMLAGGVGAAPISYLASHLSETMQDKGIKLYCYLGARRAKQILALERLEASCSSIKIATDDGSAGHRGLITELFADELSSFPPDRSVIYACGPEPMLKRLSEIVANRPMPCQILMEQRMACGVGACLGCAIDIKAADGKHQYARVCKEGPVFDIEDVVWK
jgi:dihydroorotate dehydrogenase electron transfer subunit